MVDVKNCCRICLDVESDHVSVLEDPAIVLHIKSCLTFTISPNDHLPKSICVSCAAQLAQFYNFQLNANCSQDWLESTLQVKKKSAESKIPIQPLPDSEYNSDSLLEFLNNTANIEEYLNNLGKDDIPSIVNMLDRNEQSMEISKGKNFKGKISPMKIDIKAKSKLKMEIDVLDSDVDVVKEILLKADKAKPIKDKTVHSCFACKNKFDNVQKLLQHTSTCDFASRTCMQCDKLFDSKTKMQEHSITDHPSLPLSCNCGEQFPTKEKLIQHHKVCHIDYGATIGCTYSCKKCGEVFKERFAMYKHAKEHVLKSEERFCDICGHIFTGDDALVKHKEADHKKPSDVTYRCKVCFKTFIDRKEIYLHVQKHLAKSSSFRLLCESCGHSFATLSTLTRHSLQHCSKNFKCHVCGKEFTVKKTRDDHILEHMTVCEKCGQAVSNTKLDVHSCV